MMEIFQWFYDSCIPIVVLHGVLTVLGCAATWRPSWLQQSLSVCRVLVITILVSPLLLSVVPSWTVQALAPVESLIEREPALEAIPGSTLRGGNRQFESADSISWRLAVLVIWIMGGIVMGARLGIDAFRLRNHLKGLPELKGDALAGIQQHLPEGRRAQVLVDSTASAPYSFRFKRACLVVPKDGLASEEPVAKACIVAHEWAHLRHFDSLDSLLWRIVQVLYWWNPLVYRLARKVSEMQEWRADEEATGSDLRSGVMLSRALLRYASMERFPALVQSVMSESTRALKRRIERIAGRKLEQSESSRFRTNIGHAGLGVAACLCLSGVSTMMPAGEDPQKDVAEMEAVDGGSISVQMIFIEQEAGDESADSPVTAILTPEQMKSSVQAAKKQRKATTVTYPATTTESGTAAIFNSTVSEPVSMGNDPETDEPSVHYLPVGTVGQITPTLLKTGEIYCDVSITISDIIGRKKIAVTDYPVVSSRIFAAPIKLAPGRTISIRGLDEARSTEPKRQLTILITPLLVANEEE